MSELVKYDAACRALAECSTVDEVKDFHDKAIAFKVYAKQAGNQEMVANAERIMWRAKERLGEMLGPDVPLPKTGRPTKSGNKKEPLLASLGISKKLSMESQWLHRIDPLQKEAAFGEEEPEARLKNLIAKAKREARHEEVGTLAKNIEGQFALIYADPPWKFQTFSEKGLDEASPDKHYPTMAIEDIEALVVDGRSVVDLATPDCGLFLWCTSANLLLALGVMEAWGFKYSTHAIWDKQRTGTGYIFLNQHELLLYGKRGKFMRPAIVPPSVFSYPRGRHSAKPPEIRSTLEQMYPAFNSETRIELFCRDDVDGWTTWGYEA